MPKVHGAIWPTKMHNHSTPSTLLYSVVSCWVCAGSCYVSKGGEESLASESATNYTGSEGLEMVVVDIEVMED